MNWPRIEVMQQGRLIVRDGFRWVFFLNESHASLRSAIEAVLNVYLTSVGDTCRWLYVDDEGFTQELNRELLPDLLGQRFSEEYASSGGLKILDSDTGIPGFEFYYYGKELPDRSNRNLRNYVHGSFSRELAQSQGAEKISAVVNRMASILPLSSGYASPALFYSQEPMEAFKRALRYPGFDVLDASAARVDIDNKLAGVYWLSFLGAQVLDLLGGVEVLAQQLPGQVTVSPLGAGISIMLGGQPLVGDTNRGLKDMDLYRVMARMLEPILHVPEITYVTDEMYVPDREMMLRWHRRFLD
jgi:hypothetical protein